MKHTGEKAVRKSVPGPGAVKLPRRRSGTVASQEVKRYQSTTERLIPRASFRRLVREVAQDFKCDLRFTKDGMLAFQDASEVFIIQMMRDANEIALHAQRNTLMMSDFKLMTRVKKF